VVQFQDTSLQHKVLTEQSSYYLRLYSRAGCLGKQCL